jgi:dienelactone hydrolase
VQLKVPATVRVDERLDVTITPEGGDVPPGQQPLSLSASLESEDGVVWRGEQPIVLAGAEGVPHVVGQNGQSRQWSWASAAEQVICEATPSSVEQAERSGLTTALSPVRIQFELTAGPPSCTVTVARDETTVAPISSAVRQEVVTGAGLEGILFLPPGPGPFPGVLVLTGSGGGHDELKAARLASAGFAAFAIAYFAAPGVPDELVRIDLRYFERAITWLLGRADVTGDQVSVLGTSRGGELTLLLASRFPVIGTAVAYVPSGIVHSGIYKAEAGWLSDVPSWMIDGEPVTYLDHDRGDRELSEPVACSPVYAADLFPYEPVRRATIPVEQSNAGILLLSGTDDDVWPSTLFCELVMARLRRYAKPVRHLAFPGAGHRFVFPTLPGTVTTSVHPQVGERLAMGGNAAANSRAARIGHDAVLHALRGEWDAISEDELA